MHNSNAQLRRTIALYKLQCSSPSWKTDDAGVRAQFVMMTKIGLCSEVQNTS